MIWHLIGCVLPLLLIFLLPLFGVSDGIAIFLFIVFMFGCHLLMMRGHGHGSEHDQSNRFEGGSHAHAQR